MFEELLCIQTRETESDSEDAPAPDRVIVAQAIKLCHALQLNERLAASRVSSGVNGTIYLEWITEDDYFEIEVGAVFVF